MPWPWLTQQDPQAFPPCHQGMDGWRSGSTFCCAPRLHPLCLNKHQDISVAMFTQRDVVGPGTKLDCSSPTLLNCQRAVPGHSPGGGTQEGPFPASSRNRTALLPISFTPHGLPALSQGPLLPQTSLLPHPNSCDTNPAPRSKTPFLWAAAQLPH